MKEGRAERTKTALGGALFALLERKELDEITISELSAACGVNRQTFYYHFKDMHALLEWNFRREAEKLARLCVGVGGLENRLRYMLECLAKHRQSLCRLSMSSAGELMLPLFRMDAEKIMAGCPDQPVLDGLRARFCVNIVADGIFSWIQEGMTESVDELLSMTSAALVSMCPGGRK